MQITRANTFDRLNLPDPDRYADYS